MLQFSVSGVLRQANALVVSFLFCANAMAQEVTVEGSGEGSGQVAVEGSGDISVASERVSATVWWVPAPLGDPDPDETALTAAVAEAVMVCPQRIIRCRGKASGGHQENHDVDGDLARGRENACIEMVNEAGGVAYGAAPGDWLNGREGDHGVLVQCAVSQDGAADLSPFGEGGAVSDIAMSDSSAPSLLDDGRLDDLSARVDQLEAVMPMLCQSDADCGRGLVCADNGQCVDEAVSVSGTNVRLLVRTGYQHRRTANGFVGDLGLTFDLGPVTVEGGVSLGAMTAIFEDDRAQLGQTVGGFAVLTFDAGDTVSIGPGFRYEENVGTFIDGDDLSLYQRFIPSLRFNFRFGEEKNRLIWVDALYERSVDAGALAPNGVGFSAGFGWDLGTWCYLGIGASVMPETTRW